MKQLLFLFSVLILVASCGEDDDGLGRITFIGRADGWKIVSINSNLESSSAAALADLTDAELAAANQTREEVAERLGTVTEEQTAVDDCDRDDIIFFLENGQMRIIRGGVTCPGGDLTVLEDFNDNFFSTDLAATELKIRNPDGVDQFMFSINELTADSFVFSGTRIYVDGLVGAVNYEIAYTLEAN